MTFAAAVGILLGSLPGYWTSAIQVPVLGEFYPPSEGVAGAAVLVSICDAVLCLALAALLLQKKPDDRMALFLSFYLLLYGIILAGPLEHFIPFWIPALGGLAYQLQGLLFFLSLPLILIFPNGQFMPRWTRWLVVISLLQLPIDFLLIRTPDEWYRVNTLASQLAYLGLGTLLIIAVGVQVYRYRVLYTPLERRQTKWVLYGVGLWLGLLTIVSIPYLIWQSAPPGTPVPWWVDLGSLGWFLCLGILPLAFAIAILRTRLWDIDVIIRRTVTYALLAALLAAAYLSSVILLQRLFALASGQRSEIITVLSTLAIAALFVPLRNWIQRAIDRRFYRKKYDAQKVLQDFGETVRDETDLDKLTGRLVQVVNETMQPRSVSVWLKPTDNSHR